MLWNENIDLPSLTKCSWLHPKCTLRSEPTWSNSIIDLLFVADYWLVDRTEHSLAYPSFPHSQRETLCTVLITRHGETQQDQPWVKTPRGIRQSPPTLPHLVRFTCSTRPSCRRDVGRHVRMNPWHSTWTPMPLCRPQTHSCRANRHMQVNGKMTSSRWCMITTKPGHTQSREIGTCLNSRVITPSLGVIKAAGQLCSQRTRPHCRAYKTSYTMDTATGMKCRVGWLMIQLTRMRFRLRRMAVFCHQVSALSHRLVRCTMEAMTVAWQHSSAVLRMALSCTHPIASRQAWIQVLRWIMYPSTIAVMAESPPSFQSSSQRTRLVTFHLSRRHTITFRQRPQCRLTASGQIVRPN